MAKIPNVPEGMKGISIRINIDAWEIVLKELKVAGRDFRELAVMDELLYLGSNEEEIDLELFRRIAAIDTSIVVLQMALHGIQKEGEDVDPS